MRRQTFCLLEGGFHVAPVDAAADLADHRNGLAVAPTFSVEVHLDFLAVEPEEAAVERLDADAEVLGQVGRGDLPRQVLEREPE
ncbi:MAG: hypothetical protein QN187_03105 [Armatimonadota bacterium]|nr:hypothetical protein [Armatimonadota bacterium]MDR7520165.1 hypothetical protein [Armatimonadota bacterium]MDR7550191.1 hypothetical protein [Armatimonadota bacterium]